MNIESSSIESTVPTPKAQQPRSLGEGDVLHRLSLMPASERVRFEAEAVTRASPFLQEQYRQSHNLGGVLFEAIRCKVLADHFARLSQ